MQTLYPPIQPYTSYQLPVDGTHTLYIEECGNLDGIPVVFLHGGPGAGCEPLHRRFFDPEIYRIVLFDQRGCGKSIPHAELRDNTTWHLVADIEAIRNHLNIERWLLFGGSWGSTLALAYAQKHPGRVLGMILRGIFLGRERDVRWFYQDGASRLFPDAWESFIDPIPQNEHDDLLQAYHQRLTGTDELERLRLARSWSTWEATTLNLERKPSVVEHFAEAHMALSLARIEAHYFVNHCFLQPDQLLHNSHLLESIPGVIVQGRYDVITPVDGAWALSRVWREAELQIVSPAGHAASEPAIVDALVSATRSFASQLA
jgi:proline iminopeptidase